MAFQNIYTHRKVASASSKACEICYKPSTSVLVAPENKDFFYTCPAHLKDKGFCSPIIDEAAVEAKKKKEMEAEVERVKKEFEEKQRKKKEKEKEKDKTKDKKEESKKDDEEEKKSEEKVRVNLLNCKLYQGLKHEQKSQDISSVSVTDEEPRVFALQRAFYQQRLDKKRNVEIAKRNRERPQNPNLFPAVPKGLP